MMTLALPTLEIGTKDLNNYSIDETLLVENQLIAQTTSNCFIPLLSSQSLPQLQEIIHRKPTAPMPLNNHTTLILKIQEYSARLSAFSLQDGMVQPQSGLACIPQSTIPTIPEYLRLGNFVAFRAYSMWSMSKHCLMTDCKDCLRAAASEVPDTFKRFVQRVLVATKLDYAVAFLALRYIFNLKLVSEHLEPNPDSEYRVFITAIMLAHFYLNDHNYTVQAFSKISKYFSASELNQMKVEFLTKLDHNLSLAPEAYEEWLTCLSEYADFWYSTLLQSRVKEEQERRLPLLQIQLQQAELLQQQQQLFSHSSHNTQPFLASSSEEEEDKNDEDPDSILWQSLEKGLDLSALSIQSSSFAELSFVPIGPIVPIPPSPTDYLVVNSLPYELLPSNTGKVMLPRRFSAPSASTFLQPTNNNQNPKTVRFHPYSQRCQ